jgi:hypothetical protein
MKVGAQNQIKGKVSSKLMVKAVHVLPVKP